jgi:tRNASer (uridine44-2'-O)-methyltransferase
MNGYKKRVHHDLTVKKVAFQDRYIQLKQKYAKSSVANWVECTDPRKHVFEDLAIAAFLIELWSQMYKSKNEFKFLDLGCGNGLLVHLLLSEGYDGEGIDARARKSWQVYPVHVREKLREQVIIPKVLIDQLDPSQPIVDNLTKDQLLAEGSINMVTPSPNTFIIGNHSDELTVWIPLFGYPFMVIPCCSYDIAGAKARYPQRRPESTSTYASLVDHVEFIAKKVGWNLESERLRIPSTRNAALIGRSRDENVDLDIKSVIESEGKADGWIERSLVLRSQAPRSH